MTEYMDRSWMWGGVSVKSEEKKLCIHVREKREKERDGDRERVS